VEDFVLLLLLLLWKLLNLVNRDIVQFEITFVVRVELEWPPHTFRLLLVLRVCVWEGVGGGTAAAGVG